MKQIRQPIVTVVGHVDHGKTSILDCLRDSCVQEGEKGGITQKISFTSYPIDKMKNACPLIEKSGINLNIPGFLLIDTPGHAAFTNLRKRGGSLADLAVLVIDVNEGIKPQTAEVIQILKHNKTPFLIALNKIDNVSGWRKDASGTGAIKDSVEAQAMNVKMTFDERYMTLIGALNAHGFDADLYYNINDFTKKIALVPCSARTKEGIPELIMMLCGLSQKYLGERLELHEEARGVLLEVKKEKSGSYIDAILHDGVLHKEDEIAVASFSGEPIISKIRVLEEIQPLCSKFKPVDKVQASTGIRLQLIAKEELQSGMPFVLYKGNKEDIKENFKSQISENIKTEKQGIIAKADSLGSLEALLVLLKEARVPIVKAGIGNINKSDIISAKANLDINELDAVIVGFNVKVDEEADELRKAQQLKIKIFTDEVVYKLIEDLGLWREEKRKDIEKKKLMALSTICKLEILHDYVFRNSNPAIFGARVVGGKLKSGLNFIDENNEKIGRIKNVQHEKKSVNEAVEGQEVAISIPGVNFERVLKESNFLYADIGEKQFRAFKKNKDLLSESEKKVLREISEIKRAKKGDDWGV